GECSDKDVVDGRARSGAKALPATKSSSTSVWLATALIAADVAEAKFVEFRPRRVQLMQSIHHSQTRPQPDYYKGNGLAANTPARPHVDGMFRAPTDVAFDADDNIYISDGYINSRVAKFDKHGTRIKSWGSRGSGGAHANENPGQLNTPHNIGIDRQNNVYVADRGNRRIQVFDRDGNFQRFILLNAAYDKKRHPVLGNVNPNPPDETQPWTICITNGPTQYLYTSDQ